MRYRQARFIYNVVTYNAVKEYLRHEETDIYHPGTADSPDIGGLRKRAAGGGGRYFLHTHRIPSYAGQYHHHI